jgi:1-acyl-sn-glycerol-3-phosphate acyltransferase
MSREPFHIRLLRLAYLPYKWFVFGPVLGLSTTFFAVLAVVLAFLNPRLASKICGTAWARVNSFITPMLVRVEGRERVDPRQSYVIVANHQSQYDIFVLYGWLGIEFKWVMKKELRKVPMIGVSCERIGHIFIDRSNRQAAIETINQAKAKIVDGVSILFFPEGTRSPDGRLKLFKRGAFRMALDLELPLLPVTVVGTRDVLPAGTRRLFPGRARLVFHDPIPTAGLGDEDLPRLIDQTREAITSALPPELH